MPIYINQHRKNLMSETLKLLNNIRTLRVQTHTLTLETLEEMLEKLTIIVE